MPGDAYASIKRPRVYRALRKRGFSKARAAAIANSKGIDRKADMGITRPKAARYDHISFIPPRGVRAAARRGLAWRKEHNRGGTAVGVARARDLSNGSAISPETARRMASFFARHGVNRSEHYNCKTARQALARRLGVVGRGCGSRLGLEAHATNGRSRSNTQSSRRLCGSQAGQRHAPLVGGVEYRVSRP